MGFRQNLNRLSGLLHILCLKPKTRLGFATNWNLIKQSLIDVHELVVPQECHLSGCFDDGATPHYWQLLKI